MELIGKRLATKYEIQAELGRGGMGVVYRGYDHDLRRTVAVKVLSTQLASFPDFVQRFRHEAVAAANLHHANIVTIHDVGRVDAGGGMPDIHFLVMQFVEGETLDQWMRRQRRAMSLDETDQIVVQVAAALQFAHDRGMVHRDVKPSNIMLSSNRHVTLMDFGLVRAAEMSSVTQTGTVLGTPLYMAPEQITGAQIDRRADIYSLGVVVYELLAGEAPFMRTTPLAIAHAHVYDPPPPLRKKRPDIPPVVESVVLKALAKEPAGRYPDAHSMAIEFSRAATGRPAEEAGGVAPTLDFPGGAAKPPPSMPARPPRSGRSPLVWIASILGLLLVAVLVIAFLRNERPPTGGRELPIMEPVASATPTTLAESVAEIATSAPLPSTVNQSPEPPRAVLPTEAATSTPIPDLPTATPFQDPTARVAGSSPVNVRSGPGTDYARVGEVRGGEAFTIVGRNGDASWWQICCVAGEPAWIAASLVQAIGALEGVALVEAPTPSPTNTPVPPTMTPAPTACAIAPGPSFAQKWNRQRIGCPTGSETGITSAYEGFERGWMLWRKDNDGLYAVIDGGETSVFFYPSAEPPQFSCAEAQQRDRPQRGFSMVWCANPDIQTRIGNALDYEVGNDRPMQNFERGFMVYVAERGHVYAIYDDRTWQQVD